MVDNYKSFVIFFKQKTLSVEERVGNKVLT
jgi:hypothetical protein